MLSDADFKVVYSTGEDEPIEFFYSALLESTSFDLGLGYFSSSGFRAIPVGFAFFISRGGHMRILINNVLSVQDKEAIEKGLKSNLDYHFETKILTDLKALSEQLSTKDRHFFNCLSFLIAEKRIEFKATVPTDNNYGIAHNKYGIFSDAMSNKVVFIGSANFSENAFFNNAESISCFRSWVKEDSEIARLSHYENLFTKTWEGKSKKLKVIPIDQVKTYITENFSPKTIDELVNEEYSYVKNHKKTLSIPDNLVKDLAKRMEEPAFPFPSGARDYQKEAYQKWSQNNFQGIFAMATGSGKTITSLNCVLERYYINKSYKALVLVPTIALVEQWKKEIRSFRFNSIIEVFSGTHWRVDLTRIKNDLKYGINHNFFIISTYDSFTNLVFQKLLKELPNDLIIIADEAHNIGATNTKKCFEAIKFPQRIALSATPKREYDPEGTDAIQKYFNDKPPYCYNYSMEMAIERGNLTHYYYYPRLVHLTEDESIKYINISKRLFNFFDSKTKQLKNCSEVETLLRMRKNIIHKAINKLSKFGDIINEVKNERALKYCFTYVPEGYGTCDEGEKFSFIDSMRNVLLKISPDTTVNTFLGGDSSRNDKLRAFSEGKLDLLLAMKCLDEGVDVPRAEIGIFASSTGNPRQFIQRRGRLLRTHPDKSFARIYDMIVTFDTTSLDRGNEFFNFQRNQIKSELTRVAYFASLSDNFYHSKEILKPITDYYIIDIDVIINELRK